MRKVKLCVVSCVAKSGLVRSGDDVTSLSDTGGAQAPAKP